MSQTTHAAQLAAPPRTTLSQREILFFYVPLAASWLLMTLEGPTINAAIARLPEAVLMLAAFGVMFSVALVIESPVIMLLGTSTALARNRQAYEVLRRFVLHLTLGLTGLAFLMAWTPLYDWVVGGVMGIPAAIAEAAQPGLRIMLFWTAAIGWRRFYQGIMIRYGHTRWVGLGTIVRLFSSAGAAITLAIWGRWPGITVGATALMAGVFAEVVFIYWKARTLVKTHLETNAPASEAARLSYRQVLAYHTPLAGTSLLVLLGKPVISAALARMPDPELSLAVWPVTFSTLLIARSTGSALPEAVIALLEKPGTEKSVRRFSRNVGLFSLAVLGLVAFTPLAQGYFVSLIGLPPELAAMAIQGVQIGVVLPLLMAWQGFVRGTLMANNITRPIMVAMALHVSVLIIVPFLIGVPLGLPGVPLASATLTLAILIETLYLAWKMRSTLDAHASLTAA